MFSITVAALFGSESGSKLSVENNASRARHTHYVLGGLGSAVIEHLPIIVLIFIISNIAIR